MFVTARPHAPSFRDSDLTQHKADRRSQCHTPIDESKIKQFSASILNRARFPQKNFQFHTKIHPDAMNRMHGMHASFIRHCSQSSQVVVKRLVVNLTHHGAPTIHLFIWLPMPSEATCGCNSVVVK